MPNVPIDRRTVLRGFGTALALPLLDAMTGSRSLTSLASAAEPAAGVARATTAAGAPLRSAFVFMPNGVNLDHWTPRGAGALDKLPPTLSAFEKVKNDINVLSGLALDKARANGDGPGDHARASAAFLTGCQPHKTSGKDIRLGVSIDQLIADHIGDQTPLASLELGCDRSRNAGSCDSGYSCAYTSNISWADEDTPMPKMVDPARVFDRLFGGADERESRAARKRRRERRLSVLDFVAEDTRQLEKQLGQGDRRKLDEFTTSIRDIERRVQSTRDENDREIPIEDRPGGIPQAYSEHMRLIFDMLVLAWRMDLTRVTSVMIARAGSNRTYPEVGVNAGHHHLSHHGGDKGKIENIRKIDRFHADQCAYFLQKLKETPEGESNLLDNSMIVIGSGISDGNRHNHDDLPILMAGNGGGRFKTGRHESYRRNTPLCNLYMNILDAYNIKEPRFGDSTGTLEKLT